jgi:hypothetical protein
MARWHASSGSITSGLDAGASTVQPPLVMTFAHVDAGYTSAVPTRANGCMNVATDASSGACTIM